MTQITSDKKKGFVSAKNLRAGSDDKFVREGFAAGAFQRHSLLSKYDEEEFDYEKFCKEHAVFTTQDGYNVSIGDEIWVASQSGKVTSHVITSFLSNSREPGKFDNVVTAAGAFNGGRVYATKRHAVRHGTIRIADGTRVRPGDRILVQTSGKLVTKEVVSTQNGLKAKKEHSDRVWAEKPERCYSTPQAALGGNKMAQFDEFDKVMASFTRAINALSHYNEVFDEDYTPESLVEAVAA